MRWRSWLKAGRCTFWTHTLCSRFRLSRCRYPPRLATTTLHRTICGRTEGVSFILSSSTSKARATSLCSHSMQEYTRSTVQRSNGITRLKAVTRITPTLRMDSFGYRRRTSVACASPLGQRLSTRRSSRTRISNQHTPLMN